MTSSLERDRRTCRELFVVQVFDRQTLPDRPRRERKLIVGVRVEVDKPRSDEEPGTIDDLWLTCDLKSADGDDSLTLEGHIADDTGLAAAVEERAAFQDDIGFNWFGPER